LKSKQEDAVRIHRLGIAAVSLVLAAATARAAEPPRLEEIARRYIQALERSMQKDARPADVDAVLAFCTDSYRYVHPAAGAQVDGKDSARKGMLSHVGETSGAVVKVEQAMTSGNKVALDVATAFVLVETGQRVERRNLFVLVFDGDRIALRVEF
jgi:ketosteroid isomerase-like protein